MKVERVSVQSDLDIGRLIQRAQACVSADQPLALQLFDGGDWRGNVLLSREDDETLTFSVEVAVFQGDRTTKVAFLAEPDGPVGLPIRHQGRTWTDEEVQEHGEHLRAAFYADGVCFTAETAPAVKPVMPNASTRAAAKLAQQAERVESAWAQERVRVGLKWVARSELMKAEVTEEVWPRRMPRPVASTKVKRVEAPGEPAPKRYVHKRVKA